MSTHGSTIRRRTLRVALIGGAFALISSLGVGHAFAIGPWPGDWTGPFPERFNGPFPEQFNGPFPDFFNGPFPGDNGPFPSDFNGPFPAHFNGPFPDNSSGDASAPADDWSNGNPASSLSDDWK